MRLLIDHDILMYRALWGDKGNFYSQLRTCDYMIEKVMDRLESTDITLFISGSGNYRYQISDKYKANRKEQQRPLYLYDAKNYYVKYWNACVSSGGFEADDLIGMAHDETTIVVSSDKDFYQLGGLIYNPIKDELVDIDTPQYFFWLQMMIGDQADNVEGILNPAKSHHKNPPKFTAATAWEYLAGKTPAEMRTIVEDLYMKQYGDLKQFDINGQLLFLKRPDINSFNEL